MNYITTNIRIPEEDYNRLKMEAFEKRKSFSAVIREKIRADKSEENVEDYVAKFDTLRKRLKKYFIGYDVVKELRKDRYEGHKISNY